MPPRLSALDASFLYLEQPTTPMHVGAVSVFRRPRAGPPEAELVLGAVAEAVARPGEIVDNVRVAAGDAMATVGKVAGAAGKLFSMAWTASRPAPGTPLNVDISTQRRFAVARAELE